MFIKGVIVFFSKIQFSIFTTVLVLIRLRKEDLMFLIFKGNFIRI